MQQDDTQAATTENGTEQEKTLEQKVEELLSKGWLIINESCPLVYCQTPLMTHPDIGQKYCPRCEIWHFEHERIKKQKIEDVVKMPDRNIVLKEKEKSYDFNYEGILQKCVIKSLETKLFYLSTLLNSENDVDKIKNILTTIKLCLDDVILAKSMDR